MIDQNTAVVVISVEITIIFSPERSGRGFLGGLGIGAGLGAIFGYASYSPPTCAGTFICLDFGPKLSALAGAFIEGLAGGIVGVVSGSGYTQFLLNGDITKYDELRKKLLNGPKSTLEKLPKVIL